MAKSKQRYKRPTFLWELAQIGVIIITIVVPISFVWNHNFLSDELPQYKEIVSVLSAILPLFEIISVMVLLYLFLQWMTYRALGDIIWLMEGENERLPYVDAHHAAAAKRRMEGYPDDGTATHPIPKVEPSRFLIFVGENIGRILIYAVVIIIATGLMFVIQTR